MYVIKRDGTPMAISFDKVTRRIKALAADLDETVVLKTIQVVINGVRTGIHTRDLDVLGAQEAIANVLTHPDYGTLASRLLVSCMHKETPASFSECVRILDQHNMLAPAMWQVVSAHQSELDAAIMHDNDYLFDYFGITTLQEKYLKRVKNKLVERPQYMYMRIAIQLYHDQIDQVLECYNMLSLRRISHATPTLYNAGTKFAQMSSCFLHATTQDSLESIYETISKCATISKYGGGIGFDIHNIRGKGSYIAGTDGTSNGIAPMLKVFESTALYVDQGGNKRKGSFAAYLEPWHVQIETFIELRRKTGLEAERARNLFYALWVPDLFMKRVHRNEPWTLFCPSKAPGLADVWGDEFERLYERYEREGRGSKTLPAQDLMKLICTVQIEEGMPYFLFKDHCNRKSNQTALGTIRCSNLCCEIIEFTSPTQTAVCNLAAINLKEFVRDGQMQYAMLEDAAGLLVRNLNQVIDTGYYPVPECVNSNNSHRPIGIGVAGLADAFILMRLPYEDAIEENKLIFEHIYYGACKASIELAKTHGYYASFFGSPLSRGQFQFDLWGVTPKLDWSPLRADVMRFGMRNSLLIALMPTASTAQIAGVFESFEPIESNVFVRNTMVRSFTVVNKYLVQDLIKLGLYTPAVRDAMIDHEGSIQHIANLPDPIKRLYKTRYEIPNSVQLQMAADRSAFVCQSCSQNAAMVNPSPDKVRSSASPAELC